MADREPRRNTGAKVISDASTLLKGFERYVSNLLSHTQRQISTFYRGRFVLLVPNWQYDLAASAIAVIASSRKKVVAFTDSIALRINYIRYTIGLGEL